MEGVVMREEMMMMIWVRFAQIRGKLSGRAAY